MYYSFRYAMKTYIESMFNIVKLMPQKGLSRLEKL